MKVKELLDAETRMAAAKGKIDKAIEYTRWTFERTTASLHDAIDEKPAFGGTNDYRARREEALGAMLVDLRKLSEAAEQARCWLAYEAAKAEAAEHQERKK